MSWKGFLTRLLASLLVVYATFNPMGTSYYHWALAPLFRDVGSFNALKFLAGILLLAGWAVSLRSTRRSIGWAGAILVTAVCAGLIWLLAEWHVLNAASGRVMTHVGLLVIAVVLAIGMSWSHVSRNLTGQADTDVVG
jgi:hypothetical protein